MKKLTLVLLAAGLAVTAACSGSSPPDTAAAAACTEIAETEKPGTDREFADLMYRLANKASPGPVSDAMRHAANLALVPELHDQLDAAANKVVAACEKEILR